jgi:hypothetical protein
VPLKTEPMTPQEELQLAFGRMVGWVIAVIILTLGGGIALIVAGAVFFSFLRGG